MTFTRLVTSIESANVEAVIAAASKQAEDDGRVAEWLKAPDSKSGVGVTLPWVQIPPLPPISTMVS